MYNKVYEKIKKYIKDNWLFFAVLIVLFIAIFVKIPYQVQMPGGIIDLENRVSVNGENKEVLGSFNMAYVSSVNGSIPYTLVGLINPDWEVISTKEIVYENETIEESQERDRLYLEQSKNSAEIAALDAAKIPYETKNRVNKVIYITTNADTDMKIGDYILTCEGEKVDGVNRVKEIINSKSAGDTVHFTVLNNNQEVERKAVIYEEDGSLYAGVSIVTTFDIDCDTDIEIKTRSSESGPSGGMMMALMIYNALTSQDLTNGKKIVGTGTIEIDGSVGEIGGVKYKIMGAARAKADIFLVPEENYEEAMEVKREKKYDLEIVKVSTLQDAIDYLEGLQ